MKGKSFCRDFYLLFIPSCRDLIILSVQLYSHGTVTPSQFVLLYFICATIVELDFAVSNYIS